VEYTQAHVDTIGQRWRTFLKAGAEIVYKSRRNHFACPWEFLIGKGLGLFHKKLLITSLLLLLLYG